ncbi:hypothetical protein D3C86_1855450 [compost metagenome]
MQGAPGVLEVIQRAKRGACPRRDKVSDDGHDVLRGLLEVRLKIAAADNAFPGVKIDQDQRPLVECANFRHDRPFQWHQNRPDLNALADQRFKLHGGTSSALPEAVGGKRAATFSPI